MPFYHDIQLHPGPETMEPAKHGLKFLKPGAKLNLSSFKVIFSGILSKQWKAN
jgi:hypothetical protein